MKFVDRSEADHFFQKTPRFLERVDQKKRY